MHKKGIVHRDIKADNILFANNKKDSEVKIIDFGLSSKIVKPNSLDSLVGTPYYVARKKKIRQFLNNFLAEVLDESIDYGRACDMWSLGVLIYILVFSVFIIIFFDFYIVFSYKNLKKMVGYPPFDGNTKAELFVNIQNKQFVNDLNHKDFKHMSEEGKDILLKLL